MKLPAIRWYVNGCFLKMPFFSEKEKKFCEDCGTKMQWIEMARVTNAFDEETGVELANDRWRCPSCDNASSYIRIRKK